MQTIEPITVFIIECSLGAAQPVSTFLSGSPSLRLVGQSDWAQNDNLSGPHSDVVVVALDEAQCSTLENAMRAFPSTYTMAFARNYSGDSVSAMLESGVRGLASQPISDDRLHQAIMSVAHGDLWIDHSLLSTHRLQLHSIGQEQSVPAIQSGAASASMTPRELEILQLIARGCTNKEIAAQLFLSISTIKICLGKALEKLQAADRTEAVVKAMKRGLL